MKLNNRQEKLVNKEQFNTIKYYDQNAIRYAHDTFNVSTKHLYKPFLKHIPPHGLILDVGCGSGRDIKAFSELGYKVEGLEPSAKLAEIASENSNLPIIIGLAQDIDAVDKYDGIWACASLLHISRIYLPATLHRLVGALKLGGVLFVSFKKGDTERITEEGRFFNDQTCESLQELFTHLSNIEIVQHWETSDSLHRGIDVSWTNMIIRRTSYWQSL